MLTVQQVYYNCMVVLIVVVGLDCENDLVEYLRYDGMHNLAVCMKCEFALPMEWVQKHFKDHHKILVTQYMSYV